MRPSTLDSKFKSLDERVTALRPRAAGAIDAIDRWRGDVAALRFHCESAEHTPGPALMIALVGGTGAGKSTLANRLLGANCTAASFRRTFTAGPVAAAKQSAAVPPKFLGIEHIHVAPEEMPARGRPDALSIVEIDRPLLADRALIDTPDLDGDQPAHHAQADRVFRWAPAVIFVVSPEKYQMTELLPYYRLALRYGIAALFVMNKCESAEMLADYRAILRGIAGGGEGGEDPRVFAVPRDDAGYEPPSHSNLMALGAAAAQLAAPGNPMPGLKQRGLDLLGRLSDQIVAPLRDQRRQIEKLLALVKGLETPDAGVDVNPITQQLQRRLQQRSVLYLIGPGRILDRVRQAPKMLVRLPRTAWDLFFGNRDQADTSDAVAPPAVGQAPDFRQSLIDQFLVLQSRVDDVVRSDPTTARYANAAGSGYAESKISAASAGAIAEEELAALRDWLEKRWNATPHDTAMLMKLLRMLPGGEKLTRWTEAAPYLLALYLAVHHLLFGVDVIVIGGYTLATWLTERLSNEVGHRTRAANRRIADRFTALAHQQLRQTCDWLSRRVPETSELAALERAAGELQGMLSEDR